MNMNSCRFVSLGCLFSRSICSTRCWQSTALCFNNNTKQSTHESEGNYSINITTTTINTTTATTTLLLILLHSSTTTTVVASSCTSIKFYCIILQLHYERRIVVATNKNISRFLVFLLSTHSRADTDTSQTKYFAQGDQR